MRKSQSKKQKTQEKTTPKTNEVLLILYRKLDSVYRDVVKSMADGIVELFAPLSKETVVEWCQKHINFNEPGNTSGFSLRGREYVVEPLNELQNNKVENLALVFGSQSGKTAMLMAGVGWKVYHSSLQVVWAMPGQDLANSFSENRWIPMLRNSATKDMLPVNQRKTKQNEQRVGHSVITFVGSNSPSGLASRPAEWVIMDEVDKFNRGTKAEADAVNLAEQRTKSFAHPKHIKTSTPTIESGLIWQAYLKGDQCRYYVPCPHCGKDVVFSWSKGFSIFKQTGNEAYVEWSNSAKKGDTWDLEEVRRTAHAVCPHCKGAINDYHKTRMVREGHWVATNENCSRKTRSFHLSSLYSNDPQNSFGNLAVKFLEAVKSLQGAQGFVNGELAEPWIEQDAQNRTELFVPKTFNFEGDSMKFLTVDCHLKTPRFWWVVREWWKNGNSKLIDFGNADEVSQLEEIQRKWGVTDPHVYIDSGYDAQFVYQTCAAHGQFTRAKPLPLHIGWTPSKGFSETKYWIDRKTGQKMIYGFGLAGLSHKKYNLYTLEYNSDTIKDVLHRFRLQKTEQKWAVTEQASATYWEHLSGEVKRERISDGRISYRWEKRRTNTQNHLLDCEVVQIAVAMAAKLLDGSLQTGHTAGGRTYVLHKNKTQ